jgi:Glucoamylase and related glycosyl hydrolases
MYRVDGSSDLDEFTLDHFEGYKGSRPVRIGNGASSQLQLDIYGEAMDSIYRFDQMTPVVAERGWNDLVAILDWLCEHWDQPDAGIWETRGGSRPFMYSRLQTWVAFDRAIKMATERSRPADVARWTAERDRLYRIVLDKGWNPKLKAFVQYEGSDVLDSSTLLMPAVGIIVPTDEKWATTMTAMDKTLVTDSLVYRYDPKASPGRPARIRGHLLAVHRLVHRRADPLRPPRRSQAHLREDAHLRQPRRPVLRRDRDHRRATWQLPAGIHPPVLDQRRDQPQPPA